MLFNEETKFFLQSGIPVWQWLPVYPLRQLHVKLLMPSTQEPPFWQVWFTQSLMSVNLIGLNLFPYKTWQQARVIKGAKNTSCFSLFLIEYENILFFSGIYPQQDNSNNIILDYKRKCKWCLWWLIPIYGKFLFWKQNHFQR